ncbi:MAG TPA: hypothetical protein VK177_19905 [Flavobacteriales bacterium]|nr:hypothetical protein [Flavobacteriales bacterium]
MTIFDEFDSVKYDSFSTLPLPEFDTLKHSVYVTDKTWKYMYVNKFVEDNLKIVRENLIGQNMWDYFPALAMDPSFRQLKENTENHKTTQLITVSPINQKRLHITGYPLQDCYLFFSGIMPDKNNLLLELRKELPKAEYC